MSETVANKSAIEKFVRKSLGCTCPNEVFNFIRIEHNPVAFGNLQQGYLLTIGGVLLVYVVETHNWESVTSHLEQIFMRGREMRDTGEFNRFRLVVVTSDIQPAQQVLLRQFDVLDDRLHLHVIEREQLPKL